MQHTPGPWTFWPHPEEAYLEIGHKPPDAPPYRGWDYVASVDCGDAVTERDLANARLIIAAPEMLNLLQLVECAQDADMPGLLEAIRRLLRELL